MTIRIRTMFLLLALGSATAGAAGKSYMALVGELIGAVESPRLVRDFCAVRVPTSASENARLYDAWKMRHKALLDAVAEQVAHADVRLKKQGAPGGNAPFSAMIDVLSQSLDQSLSAMTPEQLVQFCGQYSAFIEKKDLEAATSIPKLLSVVEYADKELASRERT